MTLFLHMVTSKNHSASDAQPDFSSDRIEIPQLLQSKNLHTYRMSRDLCAGLRKICKQMRC